ncbi:RXT2-like protein [Paraphoma chrysanthemicola]|uniref:RXT2-like protein n=1 Tax=Paraphoma chrysanthemicola TaxID=798071 RepID=A0A8K0RLH0_9PLEO|nr:RXT2-like protein [Paraphoma chrysanthemicola]
MASQQQQIIETIFGMKRKLLRRDDTDTDDGESITDENKQDLRRKVHYARGSDADFLLDPRPYKKRNPPRFDPDGDIVENDDEYEDEDDLEAVEENPYAGIHLENLLAPLTSAADLPNHPALNVAYTSTHLTDLANEAGALSRKEQITIARAKTLFVKLVGDSSFAPSALAAMSNAPFHDQWSNGVARREENGEITAVEIAETQNRAIINNDVTMEDAEHVSGPQTNGTNGAVHEDGPNGAEPVTNGASHDIDLEKGTENGDGADDASDTASQQTAHRMTTRARAQAASTPSPPQSPSSGVDAVHPLFTFSADSLPDRDLGLPQNEAEETRMLLMAYVQKQEEVARATTDLYRGLLQADRMRRDVFKWSKAEGHVGEMSDGEDWYDNEEWDLDQDLAKGRDEEDDETAVAGKKSTRQRRKPDKEDRPPPQPKRYEMDFALRCNDLKCRTPLHDRAVVTTCSHIFCTQCADQTGLSRSTNAQRACPACGASLHNPDDVVMSGLSPSEDYKTSVLSGLSPVIIMECASRGLAFHSYQTAQEIIYQEHLAKGLNEKYHTLSRQMDQLIHDANSQIKALQDKMQAMHVEQTALESRNEELAKAFKDKCRAQQQTQRLYQSLKAQVMASHVANAAGDEAEMAIHTARGDRFIDRLPGTRTGSASFAQSGMSQHQTGGRQHNRADSKSSGSVGQQQGGIGLGSNYASRRGLGGRFGNSQTPSVGMPSQVHGSRIPVLGGTRQNAFLDAESGPPYQASPMIRQPLGGGVARNSGSFAGRMSRRSGEAGNFGSLGR